MWIPIVLVALTLLYYSNYFYKLYKVWILSLKFNGPPAIPLLGNYMQFLNKSPPELLQEICELANKYGPVFRLWFATELAILVSDPKDTETILSSQIWIDKSTDYKQLQPWLNDGLLLATGKKWHKRRKVLTPAFHFKILEEYVSIFERQAKIFVDILAKHTDQKPFELYPLVTLYALDVICETAMGTCIDAQKNSSSAYVQAVKEEAHILNLRFFNIFLNMDTTFKLSSYGKRQTKLIEILHNFTNQVITDRRRELQTITANAKTINDPNDDHVDLVGIKKKQAFLDILLKSTIDGMPLTDADIQEEVDTFMFEGHDTTTSAITFTLYNLAKYQNVQQKCYEEICSVIGTDNDQKNPTTYSNLNELNYLDKVIKETLRLYPSVPAIGRHLLQDAHINGKLYPAGTNLILHFYIMGRNPKYFKDPLQFRPERFDTENLKEFDTFAYVPFSAGPRNCIGQKFAVMEVKSVVSKIIKHYQLSLVDDQEPILRSELVLRPEYPLLFKITNRKL